MSNGPNTSPPKSTASVFIHAYTTEEVPHDLPRIRRPYLSEACGDLRTVYRLYTKPSNGAVAIDPMAAATPGLGATVRIRQSSSPWWCQQVRITDRGGSSGPKRVAQ